MARALDLLLRFYQGAISPYLGAHCRYHPTCSAFAREAIQTHGAARGSWLALRRVLVAEAEVAVLSKTDM